MKPHVVHIVYHFGLKISNDFLEVLSSQQGFFCNHTIDE